MTPGVLFHSLFFQAGHPSLTPIVHIHMTYGVSEPCPTVRKRDGSPKGHVAVGVQVRETS